LYGGAADAPSGPAGRRSRATVQGDDPPGRRGDAAGGSGDAAVHGDAAEPTLDRRPDLRRDLALDALEQALYDRPIGESERLVHHSDRGVQYLSIRYTERLAEAGIEPSVGSRGDSYDNAMAESVIGLFKAEVIHRLGPWKGVEDVEFATLDWVAWFNDSRLLEPLGYVPPIEFEEAYYRQNGLPPENGFAGSTQSHDRASA